MAAPDTRKPRFLSAPGAQATPVSFRSLGSVLPNEPGRRDGPTRLAEPLVSQATSPSFAPLRGEAPRAPVPAPVEMAPPPPPPPPAPPPPDYSGLIRAVEQLRAQSEKLAAEARSDALEIGFQVARRILEMELASSPEALFSLIRSALRRAGEARTVKVRLNPEDVLRVESSGGASPLTTPGIASVELLADSTLSRGDCVVETEFGTVDGRLDTRFEELEQNVSQALMPGEPGEAA